MEVLVHVLVVRLFAGTCHATQQVPFAQGTAQTASGLQFHPIKKVEMTLVLLKNTIENHSPSEMLAQ